MPFRPLSVVPSERPQRYLRVFIIDLGFQGIVPGSPLPGQIKEWDHARGHYAEWAAFMGAAGPFPGTPARTPSSARAYRGARSASFRRATLRRSDIVSSA